LPAILLVLAAGAVWWALRPDSDLPGPSAAADPAAAVMPAQAQAAPSEPQPVRTAASGPDAHDAAATPDAGAMIAAPLRVRLRGLHAEAPWKGEVRFEWQGNDDTAETGYRVLNAASRPDPQGAVEFALPAWFATARNQKGRLRADDPNYRPVEVRLEGPLDPTREIVLDVQVVAVLEGRVVTSRGEPSVAARLSVFLWEEGKPTGLRIAEGNTREDGGYRLRVPPGSLLQVVATPMLAVGLYGEDGGILDSGTVLDNLLPAATTARSRIGAVTAVPDLVLADAADVRGVVRWDDGTAVCGARVWIQPRGGSGLGVSEHLSLQSMPNGQPAPITSATTDAQGAFRLPAVPGVVCDLRIDRIDGVEVVGEHPTTEAVAGGDVELRIPGAVVLRVSAGGARAPGATIEAEVEWPQSATGWLRLPDLATDGEGEVRAVSVHPRLRVRAVAGIWQSPALDVATVPPRVVDLALEEGAVGELLVEFTGEASVRNASFGWRRDDGTTGRRILVRDAASGPFRLRLPPGRYRLRIGPSGGDRESLLLPTERDVEITTAPQSLTLPAAFGGRFTVFATDSRGVYVAGTCRVLDADGVDRSAQFVVRDADGQGGARVGAPGDLLAGGPNDFGRILLPGDYLLDFAFPEHGAMQQRMTIKPNGIAEVRIRLP
jgi:hypothetical protein